MPRIRTWDSGRIKKATLVPRTAARAAKSGAQYAAQRGRWGAEGRGERPVRRWPEEAAANFLSNTLTDAERRVVLAPARMGYRLSKWGLRKYVQHRRAAKAQAAARTAPHTGETSPQGPRQGVARADPGSCSPWPRQSVFHKQAPQARASAVQGRPVTSAAGGACAVCDPPTQRSPCLYDATGRKAQRKRADPTGEAARRKD